MLLECNEVEVTPNDYRLHDYVITRLELRSVGEPGIDSTWFVQLTLGSPHLPSDQVRGQTNDFTLTSIEEHQAIYDLWKRTLSGDGCELRYSNFLLRCLMEQAGIHLRFFVQDDTISRFVVSLGKFELQGRLPQGVDILATYFGAVSVASDD